MTILFAAVLLTLCVSFGIYLRYIPFHEILGGRQKSLLYLIYGVVMVANTALLFWGICRWGAVFAFDYLRFGGIAYAVVLTVVNVLVIPRKLREHMFVFGVVITCNYLLLSVPNFVITFLPQDNGMNYLLVILGIYFGVLAVSCWPLKQMLCHAVTPFLQMETEGYWNTLWFIPVALFGTKFVNLGGAHNPGGVMQLISSLLYIFIIVIMCLNISSGHRRLREKQLIQKQLEGQKLHYTELKVRVEESRKLNHNLKHHIAAIRGFVDGDDKEGLVKYCDELSVRIDGKGQVPYTGNSAVDGVVYYYMQQAAEAQINFRLAGVLRNPGVADIDLCAAIGNALDNAVNACQKVRGKREISLIAQAEPHLLSIVIRNSFDGVVREGTDGLLSTRRENGYGVGLRSMEAMCKRYGGSCRVQWDTDTFTVMFLLPLSE